MIQRLLRIGVSLLLIGLLIWRIDHEALWQLLRQAQPAWLLAAGVFLTGQIIISAWRWRYTAKQLGLPLRWRIAVSEYYLAVLLNQVLPGGIIGDAHRAWRHSGTLTRRSPAFQAVMIERFSGQLGMVMLAAGTWWLMPINPFRAGEVGYLLIGFGLLAGAIGIVLWILQRQAQIADWLAALRIALLNPPVFLTQFSASLLAAIACVAGFACCVIALDTQASSELTSWLPLIPWVLFTMLIPITVAGWGLRESAAGLLWALIALPATEGVAAAVLFGLISLLSSLPGVIVMLRRGSPI